MALHTLEELHSKTADQIRALIEEGYRIDPTQSVSNNSNIFYAKLVKVTDGDLQFKVTLFTVEGTNTFTKTALFNNNSDVFSHKDYWKYYKVHDDIYADTIEEADREHKKWLAFNLGLGDIDCKDPVQAFADMLGNHICKCLHGSK